MTCRADCTLPAELLDQIAEHDLEALPELIRTIDAHAGLKQARRAVFGGAPWQQSVSSIFSRTLRPMRRDAA